MTALDRDTVAHYEDLMRHSGPFDQGGCITVVPGGRHLEAVVEQLGTTVRRSEAMNAEDFGEASYLRWENGSPEDELVWVVEDGGTIALLEANGFAGSTPEVLRPLSWGGHLVASMMWIDANGANALSVARDAEFESCNADYPDDGALVRCPTLAPYLPDVWATTDDGWPGYRAGGLAAVEAVTGFRLTRDHLEASWPAVWFRARQTTPVSPPGILGSTDPELALALLNASASAYRAASFELVVEVVRAVGVSDHPAVRTLLEAVTADDLRAIDRNGLRAAAQGWHEDFKGAVADPADPTWRRFMAGRTLTDVVFELTDDQMVGHQTPYSWFDASSAMGDDWGAFRAEALRMLQG